jgi:hypothetical protein
MILQVTIGVFVGRSSSSRRSVASEVIVVVWGASFVVLLEAPSKSVDNACMDSIFAGARGSKLVRSKRNGSKSSFRSFSK